MRSTLEEPVTDLLAICDEQQTVARFWSHAFKGAEELALEGHRQGKVAMDGASAFPGVREDVRDALQKLVPLIAVCGMSQPAWKRVQNDAMDRIRLFERLMEVIRILARDVPDSLLDALEQTAALASHRDARRIKLGLAVYEMGRWIGKTSSNPAVPTLERRINACQDVNTPDTIAAYGTDRDGNPFFRQLSFSDVLKN